MATDLRPYFKDVVENIFNRWTALRLAVEHGMAGQNGLQVLTLARVATEKILIQIILADCD